MNKINPYNIMGFNNSDNCSYEIVNTVKKNNYKNINAFAVLILSLFFGLLFILVVFIFGGFFK